MEKKNQSLQEQERKLEAEASPRRMSRRTFIRTAATSGGALLASMYVSPSLRSIGATPAYALSGCSPGKWKNHTDIWHGYATTDSFYTVFGISGALDPDGFLDHTLIFVLEQGGGGVKALGRHAVAALLNAAHPSISYPLTVGGVIAATKAALDGGDTEGTKNTFDEWNNLNCPERLIAYPP